MPPAFLGLSFEVSSLAQLGNYALGGDVVNLLRSLPPGLLRFGGITADTRVAWTDATTVIVSLGLLSRCSTACR